MRPGPLLIFDEVISGFRVARGGAQDLYGVLPDLTIMGKVIGGGLPAAAYGGSRELMEHIAPAGDVYQAGTLSGNPLAVAAALATLARLDKAAYARLAQTTEDLAEGMRSAAAAGRAARPGPQPSGADDGLLLRAAGQRLRRRRRVRHRGLRSVVPRAAGTGVYPPPSQFEAWFPSLAHGDAELDAHDRRGRRGVCGDRS